MSGKRTLDAYFAKASPAKRARVDIADDDRSADGPIDVDALEDAASTSFSRHAGYPFPIPCLPSNLSSLQPASKPEEINDKPDLELLIYEPYLDRKQARQYGEFLRAELPFYRVTYTLKRYGKETVINTPRYTVGHQELPQSSLLSLTFAARRFLVSTPPRDSIPRPAKSWKQRSAGR